MIPDRTTPIAAFLTSPTTTDSRVNATSATFAETAPERGMYLVGLASPNPTLIIIKCYVKICDYHVQISCILERIRRARRSLSPQDTYEYLNQISLENWGENMETNWNYLANKLGVVVHNITEDLR